FGGGQPFFFASSLGMPASSGQASCSSKTLSWSRSLGGGQPCLFGSALGTPLTSGQASAALAMPSPSRSGFGGGAAGGGVGGAGGGSRPGVIVNPARAVNDVCAPVPGTQLLMVPLVTAS